MVIKIKPKFSKEQIQKMLQGKLEVVQKAYIERLKFIGETFVKNARTNGNYQDQTGNLRNSIGYVILKDGKQLIENFSRSAKVNKAVIDKNGKERKVSTKGDASGTSVGREKALEVAQKFPSGLVLICVAGMDYAAAVESKGKDVISSSSTLAKNELRKAVEELWKKLQKL
ncbi:hypothetical protein EGT74_24530 [Chitinophaga lutea]|uniref:HK97 gp10 family phage protein n=1 Tax=Chitinophaga lutea TaxID=2488634 RepID=A0A3N4PA76_9BACT|nr:hypothetical protein [Chitinophaga lutea]RPE05553.1 hypothetical protein EGT74_24530 [Chitinophaga lutea]